MSAAIDLLCEADRRKIRLEVDGGDIVAEGPLTDSFIEQLRRHKLEVIAAMHGLNLGELRELAGKDWPEIESDPVKLGCFADIVAVRKMRERGEVPPHYTDVTVCRHCGPVPIHPGVAPTVEGCIWCFNRHAGRPVPTAKGGG